MYFDVAIFLEAHQVRSQVAVGYFQHLFEVIKTYFIIDHKDAHHTQPDPVIKYFIQACYRVFQRYSFKQLKLLNPFILPPHNNTIDYMQDPKAYGPEIQAISDPKHIK